MGHAYIESGLPDSVPALPSTYMRDSGAGCLGRLLTVILTVAGFTVAFWYYLPWQVALPATGFLLYLCKRYSGYYVLWEVDQVFKRRSSVLAGARIEIHEISPAPRPEMASPDQKEDPEDEKFSKLFEEVQKRRWFFVEMTIIPKCDPGNDGEWDLDELAFIHHNSPQGVMPQASEDMSLMVGITDSPVEVYDGKTYMEPESEYVNGVQRIRIRVGLRMGVDKAVLAYGLERLVEVSFPLE